MCHRWTNTAICLVATALVAGCATHKEALLPHNGESMLDIWQRGTGGSPGQSQLTQQLLEARLVLRRPLRGTELENPSVHALYTRTAENEIKSQFHRLPNPDLVMYVFPHLAGSEPVPVPGYSTVFPFYRQVQYALPGERVEDY